MARGGRHGHDGPPWPRRRRQDLADERVLVLLNRAINPLVRWLVRSPLHGLASRRIALITYTGRRTGHRYTLPVAYEMAGVDVTITVGSPDRKVWWRSLTGAGAPVEPVVRGQRRTGQAGRDPG